MKKVRIDDEISVYRNDNGNPCIKIGEKEYEFTEININLVEDEIIESQGRGIILRTEQNKFVILKDKYDEMEIEDDKLFKCFTILYEKENLLIRQNDSEVFPIKEYHENSEAAKPYTPTSHGNPEAEEGVITHNLDSKPEIKKENFEISFSEVIAIIRNGARNYKR